MVDIEGKVHVPVARRLDVTYDAVEDRLVLYADTRSNGRRALMIPRRMLQRFLQRYGQVLRETSDVVARAAVDQQDEVLQMEHIGAIASIEDAPTDAEGRIARERAVTAPADTYLATKADLHPRDGALTVAFYGLYRDPLGADGTQAEPVCALVLNRTQAHLVLAILHKHARRAQWGLDEGAAWLDKTWLGEGPTN